MTVDTLRGEFERTGVLRLEGAFSATAASAMSEAVWCYAEEKVGVRPDDPATWPDGWHGIGWKGLRRSRVFDAVVDNEAVQDALAEIFGPEGWTPPKPGAQVLVTLPSAGPWVLPDGWHMDCGFERPTWPTFAVKLFAFFGDVGPAGGGTMVLGGSHRVVDRYRGTLPPGTGGGMRNWRAFLRHDPFLAQLLTGATQADGGRGLVGRVADVGGIPVEVIELTGKAGDVVITDLHVFHSASANVSDVPRQMLGKLITAPYGASPALDIEG